MSDTSNTILYNQRTTYRVIVAILERSSRCAASTADTIAPSRADRSHSSSVTKNFLARLKNADGPFETLTAITCLVGSSGERALSSPPCSDECSDAVPVVAASNVVGVVGVSGPVGLSTSDNDEIPTAVASVPGAGAAAVVAGTGAVGGSPTSDLSPPLPLSDIILPNDVKLGRSRST